MSTTVAQQKNSALMRLNELSALASENLEELSINCLNECVHRVRVTNRRTERSLEFARMHRIGRRERISIFVLKHETHSAQIGGIQRRQNCQ